jgi:hypothetical protein
MLYISIYRFIFREIIGAYSGEKSTFTETRCGQNSIFGNYSW